MKSYLWEPEQLVDSYTTITNTPPPPPLPPPSPPPLAKQLSSERRDASCTSAPPCEPPPPPRGNSNIDYLMRIITIVLVSRWQCLCQAEKRVPQHSTSSSGFTFFWFPLPQYSLSLFGGGGVVISCIFCHLVRSIGLLFHCNSHLVSEL